MVIVHACRKQDKHLSIVNLCFQAVIIAICCLATSQARPGYEHGGSTMQLKGVPDESHYGKLTYPHFDVIHLGSAIKDSLPPAVVHITKKVIVKEPQPYPVKVPVPVPHPVEVAKPYPVIQTKIIKVPHPVPYEVIKKVAVPFEVPKPYPVPTDEFKAPHIEAPVASYGGSFSGHDQLGGHQQLNEVYEENQQSGGYGGGYDGGFEGGDSAGGYSAADQSVAHESQVQPQGMWVPLQMGQVGGEGQQAEEQH